MELFTTTPERAIYHVEGERPELRKVIGPDDVPGPTFGAWFAGDAWHVLAQDRRSQLVLTGKLGSELTPIDDRPQERSACVVG